jgi:hypothetical protein
MTAPDPTPVSTATPMSSTDGTEELLRAMTDRSNGTVDSAQIQAQYPELFEVPSDPPAPRAAAAPPAARRNMFAALRAATLRTRPAKALAIGAAIGALGGSLWLRDTPHHGAATAHHVASSPGAFDSVRALVRVPAQFARAASSRDAGPEFAAGARAAAVATFHEVFAATTDPEIRLAVLAAQVESGVREHSDALLVDALRKIELIPGSATDRRALRIKAAVFSEFGAEHPDRPLGQRWTARAQIMEHAVAGARLSVQGEGLTPETERQVAVAITSVQEDRSQTAGASPAFARGYQAAANQTAQQLLAIAGPAVDAAQTGMVARR